MSANFFASFIGGAFEGYDWRQGHKERDRQRKREEERDEWARQDRTRRIEYEDELRARQRQQWDWTRTDRQRSDAAWSRSEADRAELDQAFDDAYDAAMGVRPGGGSGVSEPINLPGDKPLTMPKGTPGVDMGTEGYGVRPASRNDTPAAPPAPAAPQRAPDAETEDPLKPPPPAMLTMPLGIPQRGESAPAVGSPAGLPPQPGQEQRPTPAAAAQPQVPTAQQPQSQAPQQAPQVIVSRTDRAGTAGSPEVLRMAQQGDVLEAALTSGMHPSQNRPLTDAERAQADRLLIEVDRRLREAGLPPAQASGPRPPPRAPDATTPQAPPRVADATGPMPPPRLTDPAPPQATGPQPPPRLPDAPTASPAPPAAVGVRPRPVAPTGATGPIPPPHLDTPSMDPGGVQRFLDTGEYPPNARIVETPTNAAPGAPGPVVRGDNARGIRPEARAAVAEAGTEALAASGTPAAQAVLSFGAGLDRNVTDAQRERGTKAFLERYKEVGVPMVVETLVKQGRFEDAIKFQAFIEQDNIKAGMRDWSQAAFALTIGDIEKAGDHLLSAYNRMDYLPDGYTIDKESSGFTKDEDGNLTGAKITFNNEETGDRFEQVFDDAEDLVTTGITLLAPEAAFEAYQQQLKAARGAQPDPVKQREDTTQRVRDIIDRLSKDITVRWGELTDDERRELVRREMQLEQGVLYGTPPAANAPSSPPVAYRPTG